MVDISIERNRELSSFYKKHECKHQSQALRRRVVKSGVIQYVEQCLHCGQAMTQPIKRETAIARNGGKELLPFDDGLVSAKEKAFKEAVEKITGKYATREEFEKAEFDKWYGEYLLSDAWKKRRKHVFERAGKWCEGCRERPATQVHHLTYAHVGNEMLFELVAICDVCHALAHGEEQEEQIMESMGRFIAEGPM